MTVLVRDAAAPNHPVVGIAALGSSMAQQTLRDQWIGWDSEEFIKKVTQKPSAKWCRWVHSSLARLLAAIYQKDLIEDGLLTPAAVKRPSEEAIKRLQQE